MIIFIGNPQTKRFELAVKCSNITRDIKNDNVLYVDDDTGYRYMLIYKNSKDLGKTILQLRDNGRATAHCEYKYLEYDDLQNEIPDISERELSQDFYDDFEIERD